MQTLWTDIFFLANRLEVMTQECIHCQSKAGARLITQNSHAQGLAQKTLSMETPTSSASRKTKSMAKRSTTVIRKTISYMAKQHRRMTSLPLMSKSHRGGQPICETPRRTRPRCPWARNTCAATQWRGRRQHQSTSWTAATAVSNHSAIVAIGISNVSIPARRGEAMLEPMY